MLVCSQMEILLPGGWEEPIRDILTGEDQDLAYRSVPVVLKTIALTPNTTVTVMLTCEPGECTAAFFFIVVSQTQSEASIEMFIFVLLFSAIVM